LQRLTEMSEDLADGCRLCDERDQPDVAAATRTRVGKLPPRHELGLGNSRRVVGAMFRIRVTALVRRVTSPACWLVPLLRGVANRRCRDGSPQPVIRREHPMVAVPMLPERQYHVRQTVKKLKR